MEFGASANQQLSSDDVEASGKRAHRDSGAVCDDCRLDRSRKSRVARGDADDALEYIADIVPVSGAGGAGAGIDDPAFGSLVDAVGAELGALGVRIDVDPASSVDHGVLGDSDIVVITNLCRNAAEAGAMTVRLLLSADAERVWGDVADDGPGIPADQHDRVFKRFYRLEQSRYTPGNGLGLSLVAARLLTGSKVSAADRLPFGPCLAVGIWVTWIFGPPGL